MSDSEALLAIQELMDGVEWTPDTLDSIAQIMVRAGYRIRDLDDVDLTEADSGRPQPLRLILGKACPKCGREPWSEPFRGTDEGGMDTDQGERQVREGA